MSPIVSSRRPRERSHQPTLDVLGRHGEPNAPQTVRVDSGRAGSQKTPAPRRPALQIVPEANHEVTPVLLAGADARRRAMLRAEFSATMPPGTPFSEAEEVAEVLRCAASSRMVILAGDLEDADAGSLMGLLGRRHPLLPVISVEAVMPAVVGAHD